MSQQSEFFLYISLISKFYDKVTTNHPRREQLKILMQNFKQELHSKRLTDAQESPRLPRGANTSRKIQNILSDYTISLLFPDNNNFYRTLGFSYLLSIVTSNDQQLIKSLGEEMSAGNKQLAAQSQHSGSSSVMQSVALKKILLLLDYFKVAGRNAISVRSRLETIANEDKQIFAKMIKILLITRKPSLAPLLLEETPSQSLFPQVAQLLDITLVLFQVKDNSFSKKSHGHGRFQILVGYDASCKAYFNMSKKNPDSKEVQDKSRQERDLQNSSLNKSVRQTEKSIGKTTKPILVSPNSREKSIRRIDTSNLTEAVSERILQPEVPSRDRSSDVNVFEELLRNLNRNTDVLAKNKKINTPSTVENTKILTKLKGSISQMNKR